MKTCFKCQKQKPPDGFYRHPGMADGRLGKCKECAKEDVHANRQLKAARYLKYDRERASRPDRVLARKLYNCTPRGKRTHAEACKWYRKLNPERAAAHDAVNNAVRDGRLERKGCEACGAKAQAHHDDYTKPLDVRWLCDPHHKARHRELKAALQQRKP